MSVRLANVLAIDRCIHLPSLTAAYRSFVIGGKVQINNKGGGRDIYAFMYFSFTKYAMILLSLFRDSALI